MENTTAPANTVRLAYRAVRSAHSCVTSFRYYMHINCACRIGESLTGTYDNTADAIASTKTPGYASPKVVTCSKSTPIVAQAAPVEPTPAPAAEVAPEPVAVQAPAAAPVAEAPAATVTVRATGDDGLGTARRALVLALVQAAGGTATVAEVFVKGYKAARHYDITVTGPAELAARLPGILVRAQECVTVDGDAALAKAVADGVTGPARARLVIAARRTTLADLTQIGTVMMGHLAGVGVATAQDLVAAGLPVA